MDPPQSNCGSADEGGRQHHVMALGPPVGRAVGRRGGVVPPGSARVSAVPAAPPRALPRCPGGVRRVGGGGCGLPAVRRRGAVPRNALLALPLVALDGRRLPLPPRPRQAGRSRRQRRRGGRGAAAPWHGVAAARGGCRGGRGFGSSAHLCAQGGTCHVRPMQGTHWQSCLLSRSERRVPSRGNVCGGAGSGSGACERWRGWTRCLVAGAGKAPPCSAAGRGPVAESLARDVARPRGGAGVSRGARCPLAGELGSTGVGDLSLRGGECRVFVTPAGGDRPGRGRLLSAPIGGSSRGGSQPSCCCAASTATEHSALRCGAAVSRVAAGGSGSSPVGGGAGAGRSRRGDGGGCAGAAGGGF